MSSAYHRLLALSVALLVASAGEVDGQVAGGFKAGVALADMGGPVVGDVESRSGMGAGAFLDLRARSRWSVQLEVLYMQRGAVELGTIDAGTGLTITQGTWKYDYLDLAVLAKASFGSGPTKTALYAGPYAGILLAAQAVGPNREFPLEDRTRPGDLGLATGLTIETSSGLLLDLRYSLGLTGFDAAPLSNRFDRRQRLLTAMVGFIAG